MPEITSPLKAIRAQCTDCSGGSINEAKKCPVTNCPLYPFRMGHNPFVKKREWTPEEREAARARLQRYRDKKKGESNDQDQEN